MRARRSGSALPTVALAGYTNAGKSTLLNAMTGAGVGVGERLFHTLDPTTRAYRHHGRRYLVTDTVGFIRKLPHQLVEAFKATLEETALADLIVHVVDASEPEEQRREAIAAVDSVLEEIGAGEAPRLLVYNKADLPGRRPRRTSSRSATRDRWRSPRSPARAWRSFATASSRRFEETLSSLELLFPYSEGAVLAELHEVAGDLDREDRPDGVLVRARVPAALAHRFTDFALNGAGASGDGRDGSRPRRRTIYAPAVELLARARIADARAAARPAPMTATPASTCTPPSRDDRPG